MDTTMHCDLGFEETTEEFTYLADADCSVGFKFPLPPRSAIFRCCSCMTNFVMSRATDVEWMQIDRPRVVSDQTD